MGAVSSVADVVTKAVDTVVDTIDNTVKSIEKDPIGTVAKVVTAVVAPELLPVVSAADAVAQGASPEQALKSAAAGYVAGQAVSGLGSDVASSTGSQVAGSTAQGAAQGALSTALQGGDPLQGAVSGAINAGMNTGADVLASNINQAANTPTDASILNYKVPDSVLGDYANLPDTSNIGQMTPVDYSISSGTSGEGLDITGQAPNLPSMRGGQGLTLQTDQGTLSAAGLTAPDSVPVLGDPSSFINNPDVTGTPVTTVPSDVYNVNAPNLNYASALTQGTSTAKTPTVYSPTTQQTGLGVKFLDVVNPWLTVGQPMIAGGLQEQPLQQLYGDITPAQAADGGSIQGIDPDLMRVMMSRVGYPDGGSVDPLYGLMDTTQKFIQEQTPKFTKTPPVFLRPQSQLKGIQLSPLTQLKQAPRLGTLAKGGLPSKYAENAPDGHKPEFITGITGYYAGGRGTGQSDDIPAMLHDGDYVIDAEAVSALGDGSSKAGKDVLTHFLHQVPHKDGAEGNPVPAKIADGEFVLPASFVTSLGGGDNKRGAKMLDEMRQKLREHKRSAPLSKIPPKAKSPLDYLKGAKG